MFRAKWQRSKDAKKKLIVRIIENYQNLIIQLQLNILLILKSCTSTYFDKCYSELVELLSTSRSVTIYPDSDKNTMVVIP
jgi:hypothetical protein